MSNLIESHRAVQGLSYWRDGNLAIPTGGGARNPVRALPTDTEPLAHHALAAASSRVKFPRAPGL